MRNALIVVFLLMGICLGTLPAQAHEAAGGHGKTDEGATYLHHMHTLMNHSLIMVLQGSNLLMHSQVQPSQPLGRICAGHGREMMAEGKSSLKDVLSGREMKKAHEEGEWSDPLMGYTHELGAELLAVVGDLEQLDLPELKAHQRQIALNHALEMAAEGSNLVMLGSMKTAGAIDERMVLHGRKMIAQARKFWDEVSPVEGLKDAQGSGAMPQQREAARAFVRHGGKVLSLLEKMSVLHH